MIIRRTYTVHEGNEYNIPTGQILVTFNDASDIMNVAFRPATYATWSRPFVEDREARQDDQRGPTRGSYPVDGGRTYSEIPVLLTPAEIERLFASAASYEHSVNRAVGVGDHEKDLATRALDKLARALHPSTDVSELAVE